MEAGPALVRYRPGTRMLKVTRSAVSQTPNSPQLCDLDFLRRRSQACAGLRRRRYAAVRLARTGAAARAYDARRRVERVGNPGDIQHLRGGADGRRRPRESAHRRRCRTTRPPPPRCSRRRSPAHRAPAASRRPRTARALHRAHRASEASDSNTARALAVLHDRDLRFRLLHRGVASGVCCNRRNTAQRGQGSDTRLMLPQGNGMPLPRYTARR